MGYPQSDLNAPLLSRGRPMNRHNSSLYDTDNQLHIYLRHFKWSVHNYFTLANRDGGNRTHIFGGMGAPLPPVSYHLITSQYTPYPQRCVLLPHCQTVAFSVFSLDWFSGYQQEEDSFLYNWHHYPCNGRLFKIGATVFLVVLFGELYPSGLTWEDTTAYTGKDLHLTYDSVWASMVPTFKL